MKFFKIKLYVYFIAYLFLFPVASYSESTTLTAAGNHIVDTKSNGLPLLVVSMDNGKSWSDKTPAGDQTKKIGSFNDTRCTGNTSKDICIAVGNNSDGDNLGNTTPLLAVSSDGGQNWNYKNINGLSHGSLISVSCIQYDSSFRCITVGRQKMTTGEYAPLYAISSDSGNTWTNQTIKELPNHATALYSVSCSGKGSTAVCAMIGRDTKNHLPVFMTSSNGGDTWVNRSYRYNYVLTDTSCTGNGSKATCVVVGYSEVDSVPFLSVSTDGTKTWLIKTVRNMPNLGELFSTSCTNGDGTPICIAVGKEINYPSDFPILTVSQDGGTHWEIKKITSTPVGILVSASCTGAGATAVCVAVGNVGGWEVPKYPLLVTSVDGGNTWNPKKTPVVSTDAYFLATHCSGNGSTAICIAGGQEEVDKIVRPLLTVSTDGANTWDLKDFSQISEGGYLSAVSSGNN